MKKAKDPFWACWWQWFLSLGLMGGINGKSHDSSLQQVAGVVGYYATQTEGVLSVVLGATALGTRYVSKEMIKVGIAAAPALTTNPYGWTWWRYNRITWFMYNIL
jgi:hypothetical protein